MTKNKSDALKSLLLQLKKSILKKNHHKKLKFNAANLFLCFCVLFCFVFFHHKGEPRAKRTIIIRYWKTVSKTSPTLTG